MVPTHIVRVFKCIPGLSFGHQASMSSSTAAKTTTKTKVRLNQISAANVSYNGYTKLIDKFMHAPKISAEFKLAVMNQQLS